MKPTLIKFGIKNFRGQLGLPSHLTLRGFFRRIQLQYPKTSICFRFIFGFSVTTLTALLLIPGSHLPKQSSVKIGCSKIIQRVGWILFLNSLNPQPVNYIKLVYNNLEWKFEHKIFLKEDIIEALASINQMIQALKQDQILCENELRTIHIACATKVLLKLIQHQQTLIKQESIVHQYERIATNSLVNVVYPKEDKVSFTICFKIFDYLLKYSKDQLHILKAYREWVNAHGKHGSETMSQHPINRLLKQAYVKGSIEEQQQVLHIFDSIHKFKK